MLGLIKPFEEINEYKSLLLNIRKNAGPVAVYGLSESQRSHMAYSLFHNIKRPLIFITYNDLEAKKVYEDLLLFTDNVCFLPSKEVLLYDVDAISRDIVSERLKVIKDLINNDHLIVVTSVDNIAKKYVNPNIFKKYTLELNVGDTIDLMDLTETFIISGYERVDIVEGKGQFSIRGGIIDFYSLTNKAPYRIELFDDEIDSIREFDILTQRSTDKVDCAQIFPARETIIEKDAVNLAVEKINREYEKRVSVKRSKKEREYDDRIKEKVKHVLEKLKEAIYFEGIDSFLPYFYNRFFSIFNYFKLTPLVVVDEPSRVLQRMNILSFEFQELFENLLSKGEVLPSQGELLYTKEDALGMLNEYGVVTLNVLPKLTEEFNPVCGISFTAVTMHPFHGQIEILIENLEKWKRQKYKTVILSGTPAKGQRLVETLKEKGIESVYYDVLPENLVEGQIMITRGALNRGFEYPIMSLAVISDREIFGEAKHKRRAVIKKGVSQIKSFTDLKLGDYVVHVNHGIGSFQGVKQLVVEGIKKDYLDLRYASGDKLYVPVDQLDMVQKYIGAEGKPPKIHKLGGTDWVKAKARVKESIKAMADDLVKLYALRQEVIGHSFPKDTPWQKQFEEEFPYEETPDQLTAIEDIKKDMERSKPMDRLLCGDVGYGKTEVAIRAAFKAVMDGKQVAFLVPTTILAEQHYNNFVERFTDFPVKIDMISRFRTPAQQKKTLLALKEGRVDMLVGTHRLLQKDVKFRDLGLLIVDEEQRFGVTHKEAIKSLKKNVDVLTLSATPIPRTLHMSLLGVRDMSVIETPPEERYPIQTYVVEYNEQLIRDAIVRELTRGGQTYFVYNRVETIRDMYAKLSVLVPEAKIAIGHGQMSEHELENVMISFLKGEYDVLLSTTIIETGLDIPNVNTLIVYDSDRMGLSQLYQLRGRVGRSNRLAFAYFTYKRDKILAEVAEKRLRAIKEFTELGSGFKIAMRDLEIRGAGNLLGPEQHGHMDTVGYDMYCRLLEEAIHEVKGENVKQSVETSIDLSINAYIDSSFIGDETQKIEIYKRIASIRDLKDMYDIQEEVEDRFGNIPESLDNLLRIAYIKALASNGGIVNINQKGNIINIYFGNGDSLKPEVVMKLIESYGKLITFNATKAPYFTVRLTDMKNSDILALLKDILEVINSLQ
ncbi:transcription-repair-coupling factor [Oxobacter pfennigii]|uniref:Transcription-repair-coupling factor n=1 Tax=Oxobacter pfennigii TaxID=36849 RepID=A0A0P9ACG5_9CLOT|nr:transcription-repair coupling factor [Oxobacter pfennigii]KPU42785.1 transcription-repair-coupling factor [Oxobacter pfennigii]